MSEAEILWRRIDEPGHDACRLIAREQGFSLEGAAVFREDGKACCLEYNVLCDRAFRTRSSSVRGWFGERALEFEIRKQGERWEVGGEHLPHLDGLVDLDLAFTPATNLLSIRRLALAVGKECIVRAAWLAFPELRFEVIQQSYRRTSEDRYWYVSTNPRFEAELVVSAEGFVRDYPGLWTEEKSS